MASRLTATAARCPSCHQRAQSAIASSKTHEASEWIEPALLGQRQEMLGRNEAEGRVGPTQERFHGDHLACAEIDLGLVVQRQRALDPWPSEGPR